MHQFLHFSRIVIAFALSLGIMPTANAAPAGDALNTACADIPFRTALATVQAGGGGRITFVSGCTLTLLSTENITGNVTIEGPVTLSGGGARALFFVTTGGRLSVKNLTVRSGVASVAGAIGVDTGGELHADGAMFMENFASGYGGAISTGLARGPVDAVIRITNSTFLSNTAIGIGGAMLLLYANTHIISSTFQANTSNDRGGAIHAFEGSLYITATRFLTNTAQNGGGAIETSAVQTTLKDVDMIANSVQQNTRPGGAMTVISGTTQIMDGNIISNFGGTDGGAINGSDGATLAIDGTNIFSNTAFQGGGGGIAVVSSTLALTGVVLAHNRGARINGGGGIYAVGSNVSIAGGEIRNNKAVFDNGGGGMRAVSSRVSAVDTKIISNSADRANGGGVAVTTSTLTLNRVTLANNQSNDYGGGLSAGRSIVEIMESDVSDNVTTSGSGGGVFGVDATTISISGTKILRNTARGIYVGGGLYVCCAEATRARVIGSEFAGNSAGQGGGIYSDAALEVERTRFISNTAGSLHGGALGLSGSRAQLSASVFISNSSASDGGAIFNESSFFTATQLLLQGNTSGRDGGGVSSGGVFRIRSSTFRDSTFSNNTAGRNGGAIHVGRDSFELMNSTVASNTAQTGGGISGSGIRGNVATTLTHVTLAGNSGADVGGLHVTNGTLAVRNTALRRSPFGPNCLAGAAGQFISQGNNLFDDASCNGFALPSDKTNTPAGLGGLRDNGGAPILPGQPMLTLSPVAGSALIDAGECMLSVAKDQRGVVRPIDGDKNGSALCDIGALEFDPSPPAKRVFLPALRR